MASNTPPAIEKVLSTNGETTAFLIAGIHIADLHALRDRHTGVNQPSKHTFYGRLYSYPGDGAYFFIGLDGITNLFEVIQVPFAR